jgi:hypothetical protein
MITALREAGWTCSSKFCYLYSVSCVGQHAVPNSRPRRKYLPWRPFIMSRLIILLTLLSFSSFAQEKDLNLDKYLWGQNRNFVDSFIKAGQKDFFFVDRMYPGLMYLEKYDSCRDESFLKFILVKANNSKKYEFTKYDNCGQTHLTTDSNALRFFEKNRHQIKADSIDQRIYINHTVFYSIYEFRDGKLRTYKHFCKECVDEDDDQSTKTKNKNLKLYKFLIMLDSELSGLIK